MIVVGVDGSDSSKEALRWAGQQAKITGAALDVLSAWTYPVEWGWAMTYDENFDPKDQTRRALQVTVDEVLGSQARVRAHVVEGSPADALLDAAKGAELLVVGSRGLGHLARGFLGSVSDKCVHEATCPVVVVHHD